MAQGTQPDTPSPTPEPQTITQPTSNMNVNKLGVFLDGWADLIEGKGEKADEVKQSVYGLLFARNMPGVQVKQVNGSTGVGSNKRPYNITTTHPSASTAIYVGEHGQDMFVSWRTFIKPQLSSIVIFIIIISLLAGAFWGFRVFMININPMIMQISGTQRLFGALTAFLVTSIFVFVLLSLFMSALGVVIKGDFRAYFFVEPNIFDAEDITAMSLSAHKSIIRALDKTGGVDVTKLRLKQNFKGGRTGETV